MHGHQCQWYGQCMVAMHATLYTPHSCEGCRHSTHACMATNLLIINDDGAYTLRLYSSAMSSQTIDRTHFVLIVILRKNSAEVGPRARGVGIEWHARDGDGHHCTTPLEPVALSGKGGTRRGHKDGKLAHELGQLQACLVGGHKGGS